MIPTIGRIVHTTLPEGHPNKGGHRAAMITANYADAKGNVTAASAVDLTVYLQPGETTGEVALSAPGFLFLREVRPDPTAHEPGTWHEPERAEEPKAEPAAAGGKR